MKCKKCNGNLKDTSVFCPNCGTKVEKTEEIKSDELPKEEVVVNNTKSSDEGAIGWGILGFFVPIVGIILFFVWLNDKPKSSKAAGLGALIRIILIIMLIIFIFVFFFIESLTYTTTYPKTYNGYYDNYNDNDYNYNYDYNWD